MIQNQSTQSSDGNQRKQVAELDFWGSRQAVRNGCSDESTPQTFVHLHFYYYYYYYYFIIIIYTIIHLVLPLNVTECRFIIQFGL